MVLYENYKKEVPLTYKDENGNEIKETGDKIFNIITLWRENLEKDENGNYVLNGFTDMAVAIAYLAQVRNRCTYSLRCIFFRCISCKIKLM